MCEKVHKVINIMIANVISRTVVEQLIRFLLSRTVGAN